MSVRTIKKPRIRLKPARRLTTRELAQRSVDREAEAYSRDMTYEEFKRYCNDGWSDYFEEEQENVLKKVLHLLERSKQAEAEV